MYDFLRTPLTAMCGYIELMEREPQTENGKCYLAVIRERTDAMRALRRIFDNVISNAVKYSDGDFAVETARSSTGLGLSIAKQLTEKLGGSIRAEYGGGKLQIKLSLPQY